MPTENILVVEDEENIQELIRYNLAKEGYQVTCAPSVDSTVGRGSTFQIHLPVGEPSS